MPKDSLKFYNGKGPESSKYPLKRVGARLLKVKRMEMKRHPRRQPPRFWINRKYRPDAGKGKVLVGLLSPDASDAEIEAFYHEVMATIAKAKQPN